MSVNLESKLEFKKLCGLFESISKAKGSQKYHELQKFTQNSRSLAIQIKSHYPNAEISLFSVFRLILPTLERERGPYGLKLKSLSSLYVRIFCLGKNSITTKKLTSYKKFKDISTNNDDFAERVYYLLRNRLNDDSTLTIEDINTFLDDVSESHEKNKKKNELFEHFFRKISALELKWLTRILLKDLKLGVCQKKVFEVIHPDAEELFNVTSSLRNVCDRFTDLQSNNSIAPIQIQIFSHVKPMLLEKLKIENIAKLFLNRQQYCVQTKFDGERSQLHMKDGKFKYFTRQGYDITNNAGYGETSNSGKFLTSKIVSLLNKNCRSIILDGEMMGWHKSLKSFGSKGQSYDVKKLTASSYYQPCFIAYDILLYNDELFVDKPYSERLNILKTTFTEKEGVLMLCKTEFVSNKDKLIKIFNVALDNDDEGIVVKEIDCIYRPNVREKSGCYKIKAEYSDGLVEDLDLVILGGYYGQGRCSGIVSSFLVGVASSVTSSNGMPIEFFSLVIVRSGLSDEDLKVIQDKLRLNWKDKKPIGIFGPKSKPPDLWVSPKHSLILQLRATEIIRTQVYPLGYSLRFPRVLKLRLDKCWYDTCLTTEFFNLLKDNGSVQKLTKRKVTEADVEDVSDEDKAPKIRKHGMTAAIATKVLDTFVDFNIKEATRVSRLFDGKEFCVINGDDELVQSDVIRILKQHMGTNVQNPSNKTFCVLVGNPETLKAKNVILNEKYDVVSLSWLKRATKPENFVRIQEFYPSELFSMRSSTRKRLKEYYDQYFDHYEKEIDRDVCGHILEEAGKALEMNNEMPVSEMLKLDKLLFNNEKSPFSIFRGITGYFHDNSDTQKYLFMFMSGIISECETEIDYIFVDDVVSTEDLSCYKSEVNEDKVQILSNKWIIDSFKSRKLLIVEDYIK